VIDLSLLEPLLMVLGPGPTAFDQLGVVPGRHGNRSQNSAPRNTYRTRDKRWVAISCSSQTVAERVMRLVGHPEVIEEPWFASAGQRVQHADVLDEYVGSWIAAHDVEHVVAEFERVGAALAPINTVAELMADPHVNEREVVTTVQDEDLGPLRMQNVVFRLSESPGGVRFSGRRIGQDNDAVYRDELGLTEEHLRRLHEDGVV